MLCLVKAEEMTALLGETAVFGGLPEATRVEITRCMGSRTFPRGDIIFHQGDAGESLCVVASGLVKIFMVSPDGGEMVLATLKRPQSFGELAVIDGGPRSASARAVEPTVLITLRRPELMHLIRTEPGVAEALHRSIGALLRRMLEQASDLIFLDLPGRVAKLLLRLADDTGEATDEGTLLDLSVSQGTLAGMVGGSRPSVNQILRQFAARDYVELRGRKILIRDRQQLERRATR